MLGVGVCQCLSILLPPEVQVELWSCPSSQVELPCCTSKGVACLSHEWGVLKELSATPSVPEYHIIMVQPQVLVALLGFVFPLWSSATYSCVFCLRFHSNVSLSDLFICSSEASFIHGLIPRLVVQASSLQQSTLPSRPLCSKLICGFLQPGLPMEVLADITSCQRPFPFFSTNNTE